MAGCVWTMNSVLCMDLGIRGVDVCTSGYLLIPSCMSRIKGRAMLQDSLRLVLIRLDAEKEGINVG